MKTMSNEQALSIRAGLGHVVLGCNDPKTETALLPEYESLRTVTDTPEK
jgi:hypothetical protein